MQSSVQYAYLTRKYASAVLVTAVLVTTTKLQLENCLLWATVADIPTDKASRQVSRNPEQSQ
jgi:hypothetical protein